MSEGRNRRKGTSVCLGLVAALVMALAVTAAPPVVADAGVPSGHDLPSAVTPDFWLATAAGPVEAFGVPAYGSPAGPLNRPVVAAVATHDVHGYWLVAGDGGIFSYGDAHFFGSTGNLVLNKPIVGLAPTKDGLGYWMVAADGGIFTFGDAGFHGSTGALALNKPIIGMAPTPDGGGYWLVASDGGIFAFGDAAFHGSTGALALNKPITAMAPTPDGGGYWLVASDGGIFGFGDASFHGSAPGSPEPTERVVASATGKGYWVIQQNGTATAYGDAATRTLPPQALLFQAVTPGDRAVLFAFQQLGKPYIWGGNGPAGYDCSGLALASWVHGAGVTFARVANNQYETAGTPVDMTDLIAGDLIFWGDPAAGWTSVDHTAIYVGGNQIVEATGDQVQLNALEQWGLSGLMPNGRRP